MDQILTADFSISVMEHFRLYIAVRLVARIILFVPLEWTLLIHLICFNQTCEQIETISPRPAILALVTK